MLVKSCWKVKKQSSHFASASLTLPVVLAWPFFPQSGAHRNWNKGGGRRGDWSWPLHAAIQTMRLCQLWASLPETAETESAPPIQKWCSKSMQYRTGGYNFLSSLLGPTIYYRGTGGEKAGLHLNLPLQHNCNSSRLPVSKVSSKHSLALNSWVTLNKINLFKISFITNLVERLIHIT